MKMVLTLLAALWTFPALAGVQADIKMSGQTAKGPDGKPASHEVKAQIKVHDHLVRIDLTAPGQVGKMSYIVDKKNNKQMTVMHTQKTYMHVPPERAKNSPFALFLAGEDKNLAEARAEGYKVTKAGNESIEGQPCRVYKIRGGKKHEMKSGKVWFAKKLNGMMLRMHTTQRDGSSSKIEMSNIHKAKLSAADFIPPPGYRAFSPPKMGGPGQANIAKQIEAIQKLPPKERAAAMKKLQEQIQKQAKSFQKGMSPPQH